MSTSHPIGVLLINLGTPQDPSVRAVRRYLREFLSDPRVIDIPALARQLLLHGLILPFRSQKTSQAYQKIWTHEGSPLMVHSQQLTRAVEKNLSQDYVVRLGMRYGNPSIENALKELLQQHCQAIIVLPLFPQYSSAATGSAIAKTLSELKSAWNIPKLTFINDFYNHPGFIKAYSAVIQQKISEQKPEFILFSYHGLPERHLNKSHCERNLECHQHKACNDASRNHFCYRRQCYHTSQLIANTLNLAVDTYSVAFQSRLGRTPWIKPYTDFVLPELAARGIKKLAVVCPSFVADCLETLEEIGIRGNEQWQALTGEKIQLIPCLNSHPDWVNAVTQMISTTSK